MCIILCLPLKTKRKKLLLICLFLNINSVQTTGAPRGRGWTLLSAVFFFPSPDPIKGYSQVETCPGTPLLCFVIDK